MKNITPWFLLLSLIIGTPAFALAEEGAGTTDTSGAVVEPTTATTNTEGAGGTKPLPPKPLLKTTGPRDAASGQATGKSLNGLPPGGPAMKNMMEHRMETASGTGQKPPIKNMLEKRMENGTSGRPMLPPGMKGDMKDRMMGASGTRPMMMGSGTPKMMERMKLLKDGKMDRKMEAAKAFIKQAGERMNNAIERLEKISGRLDGAIVKMKEKGIDTSSAEALLTTAKTKISEADAAVANAIAVIESAKPSTGATSTNEVSDATRAQVKDALTKAKDAIEAAHKALVEAIKALKAAGGVGNEHSENPGTPGSTTTTP